MRKFVINVNGNQYEVEVEEVGGAVAAPVVHAAPAPAAPAAPVVQAAPAPAAPKPAAPAPAASSAAGSIKINAPMPGAILDVKVKAGDSVKRGDLLLILEAMKMENEILAPQDGTIASVNTSKGSSVNSGELLISMNG